MIKIDYEEGQKLKRTRACHEDFPEIDAGDRLRHTGYGSAMDVPDWETAYIELAGKFSNHCARRSER